VLSAQALGVVARQAPRKGAAFSLARHRAGLRAFSVPSGYETGKLVEKFRSTAILAAKLAEPPVDTAGNAALNAMSTRKPIIRIEFAEAGGIEVSREGKSIQVGT
jgi:hypothetical protein